MIVFALRIFMYKICLVHAAPHHYSPEFHFLDVKGTGLTIIRTIHLLEKC